MNRLPELKSFLKDSEAEEYQGVTVEYIHGRKAIFTIYHDGEKTEDITLSEYSTKAEMHALMQEKGFVKKSDEEIAEMKERRAAEQEDQERLKRERQEERRRNLQQNAQEKINVNNKVTRELLPEEKALDWKKRQDEKIAIQNKKEDENKKMKEL